MKPFNKSLLPWNRTSNFPGFSAGTGQASDPVQGSEPEYQQVYWIPVSSSNVDAISWNSGADYKLWVRFKDKGDGNGSPVYSYDATEDQYDDMFAASSKGRYVNHILKLLPYKREW